MGKGAQKYVTVQYYQKPGHIFSCEPLMHIWVKSKENFLDWLLCPQKLEGRIVINYISQTKIMVFLLPMNLHFGSFLVSNARSTQNNMIIVLWLLVWYFHELLLTVIKLCIRNLSASYLSAGYVRNMDTIQHWSKIDSTPLPKSLVC